MNNVVLIGRLTKDPELRYTPNGVATCTFTLAVDRAYKKDGQDREADFLPVVTWQKTAEACANHLRKGRLTAVSGRIQTRNYDNNEGKKIYVTEIIAESVKFLESSKKENDKPSDPFKDDGRPVDITDDDFPF